MIRPLLIKNSAMIFEQYDRGMIVSMCGVGVALIPLGIPQKLNSNTILIGVPDKLLLKQWKETNCVLLNNFHI